MIAGRVPGERRCLDLRPSRVAGLGGADIAEARCRRILDALGFGVAPAGDDRWSVAVPAWRHDMGCEADLVEEILRVEGFDRIPMVSLPRAAAVAKPVLSLRQRRQGWARRALAARGLEEAVTYSFVKSGHARLFGGAPESLVLVNPISSDLDAMRPSGLVSLLAAVARNQARGLSGFGLFEIGPVYAGLAADDQKTSIAGLRCGLAAGRHWSAPARPVDAFDAKADAMAVLETVGAPVDRLRTSTEGPGHFHPGRSGTLRLGATVVAAFGDIHPAVAAAMDAEGPVAGFEVLLEDVPEPRRRTTVARSRLELSPYQAVRRDFAFTVDRTVPAETLLHAVAGVERALIVDVQLFDLYRDESLGPGQEVPGRGGHHSAQGADHDRRRPRGSGRAHRRRRREADGRNPARLSPRGLATGGHRAPPRSRLDRRRLPGSAGVSPASREARTGRRRGVSERAGGTPALPGEAVSPWVTFVGDLRG